MTDTSVIFCMAPLSPHGYLGLPYSMVASGKSDFLDGIWILKEKKQKLLVSFKS